MTLLDRHDLFKSGCDAFLLVLGLPLNDRTVAAIERHGWGCVYSC